MLTLKPRHTLRPFTLRGWSILATPTFDPAHGLPCRVARIEKAEECHAPLLAAAPGLSNALALICTAYSYGTSADLARAVHQAETLLSVLDHPAAGLGGPINPSKSIENRPKAY